MLLAEVLSRFERDKEVSPFTVANYKSALNSLADFGIVDTSEITRLSLAEWISKRRTDGVSARTINTQLGGLLSLLSFLEKLGLFSLKKLMGLRRLRERTEKAPPPVFLTREEFARLRLAAHAVSPLLDLAISLSVFGGLRLRELQTLRREQLRLNDEKPYIHVKRDGHGRAYGRPAPIAKAYAAWLLESGLLPPEGPIFPPVSKNSRSTTISRETFKTWLRKARDEAELYHVTWFTLRHSFASYLRQGGVELSKISGFMGNTVRVCEAHYAALAFGGDAAIEKGFSVA